MLGFLKSGSADDALNAAAEEFKALEAQGSERVGRYKMYRDEGNRIRDPQMDVGRESWDYGRKPRNPDGQPRRHRFAMPLGKAITVKHAARIAGVLPDIIVDQRDESPQENYRSDSMEKIAWAILRASSGETQFSAASWNGSEVGSGCFDLYMDYKRNIPVFRSVDPAGIYVVEGVDDPHDFQRVFRTWLTPVISLQNEYRGQTFRGEPIDVGAIGGIETINNVDMARVVQLCDRDQLVRFAFTKNGPIGLFEYVHNYGFAPYIVIPNLGPYENVWGWADYEFVRSLTEYLPDLLAREADVLKAVSSGSYIEAGTGQNAADIAAILKDGGVVASKRDGKLEPVEAAKFPDFAPAHTERVLELVKMLGFVPDAAWGLPGSGSGTDRGLQLQPLLEYTAMKQLNWQRGLARLFGLAFRMVEQKTVGTATFRGTAVKGKSRKRLPFSIAFTQDAGPDTMTVDSADPTALPVEVQIPRSPKDLFDGDYDIRFVWRNMVDPDDPAFVISEVNKFSAGIQSLETTLENLGVQAPEDELKRIEAEAERFPWVRDGVVRLIMAQLGQAQGVGGGAPFDIAGAMSGAMSTMTSPAAGGQSGALNLDAGTAALGPSGTGQLYGGA